MSQHNNVQHMYPFFSSQFFFLFVCMIKITPNSHHVHNNCETKRFFSREERVGENSNFFLRWWPKKFEGVEMSNLVMCRVGKSRVLFGSGFEIFFRLELGKGESKKLGPGGIFGLCFRASNASLIKALWNNFVETKV